MSEEELALSILRKFKFPVDDMWVAYVGSNTECGWVTIDAHNVEVTLEEVELLRRLWGQP